ncbi:imidazole glycerol phosphate synthase subunit HisF [Buchnera aphidicola]|uniref:imidazole glycerol-phosphate synthase n=1 Tax=Buchnera aphidicola subsp. Acyrthosiphon pisum (strain 5A) TaxID=563178 RepID=A0A7U3YA59_BUCA5|nr:imidazole glycerol phosphate synthase subunit HisF [Buchnera aphidicola]OQX99644.1 MAG: imidazole glycerol phosphate synthase cyclase subunit [Erwiniaceae bacterium 4572_131]ACL29926.1 imidazole glycerol phosphate synthase subunit HisF [Buchnera aphidicola str. Tuc7 (Acyrthosiphon pisum)]ACL30479.1 imidazole glycerol phosphate synthase subunit HisF [Buchnera aphidicola str. 5A (Acyrthosiphon pisum)]ADP65930.1 imidazole glycerol phosphate synthase subunit HisF [Buchnera aphidicola str. LL01 (
MLAKRIIACLDVDDGVVVKGIKFQNHKIVGDIVPLARRYAKEGIDELVFYDITAATKNKLVDHSWIKNVSKVINIPFCVAGGIKSVEDAKKVLSSGADKISINSSALIDPNLITKISERFGVQCVVIGIDSWFDKTKNSYMVQQYTGDISKTYQTSWKTSDWVKKVQEKGAGEIVLNMMNKDGLQKGYDISHLSEIRKICKVPLIASGGAGSVEHFYEALYYSNVDGVLAASVFHKNIVEIKVLKKKLIARGMEIREC